MSYFNRASKAIQVANRIYRFSLNHHYNLGLPYFASNEHGFCSNSRNSNRRDDNNVIDLSQYPTDKIRNFSIIAHVDHGKSTLADRLLELTGTIKRGHGQPQYLDKLQAQTATMFYNYELEDSNTSYLLNLVDTPGHVDFSYEVSRSLAACQGALLVVDAAQGVQAQTVANFYLAFESNLAIIPVINKIDQPTADPDRVKAQLKSMFDLDTSDVLLTSAKTGQGLEHVLPAVIERIPPPPGKSDSNLRMFLLDSYYDEYKGVICHVAVVDGCLRKGDKITSAATSQSYEVLDVGIMHPELRPTGFLLTGQVGYMVSGFKPAKHMVFSGLYPADGSDFEGLNHAIERLTCNDASVSVARESSTALGLGFRCGFLGLLHMDVFHQRLEQEYGTHIISTVPTVPYIFEYSDGSKVEVQNPAAFTANPKIRVVASWEPTVLATIIIPSDQRAFMKYRLPLREIVVDFYNELKSITSGYASFDYEDSEYVASDVVKLDILLNGQPVDAMATIVHKISAMRKNVLAKCYGGDVTRKKKLLEKQKEGKKRMKRVGSVDIPQEAFHAILKVS
ncbi:Elongation factor 4 [Cynara cardunculus var. scolymus]|uniref:Elongation factor 4 n=1 Tax=Cynara cardunculus var. scolymus TaxID=59895 RepID=A0A103XL20_CYNCS|nr:Elongation factor 4 [Cynara cardunculus var. scolymus]